MPVPHLTRRDVRVPSVPGKAVAVIGMRRAGKTSFLWQCLADRVAAGRARESLLLVGLEDDRLAGIDASDLDWLVEEYFRRHPELRGGAAGGVTLCLDEIQMVPGWERFARRLIDTERIELLLSGSSAKLLSREVATSLRGRAVEALVHPFGFREALRHADADPGTRTEFNAAERSALDAALRVYLETGGFPEAQGLAARDRVPLLRGYVDVVVLRDVIERHAVSNPVALRWLQRQLLSTPAGAFSVQKLFNTMRSQGLTIGKDTLHEYLGHLEDAFLVRTVWMHSASERQRMVNPRKVYPVDPGLIAVYERSGRAQTGHALETAVLLELERRGAEIAYVRTADGYEVDFVATTPGGRPHLVQVCAESHDPATLERETRALVDARKEHPGADALLLTLDAQPPSTGTPKGVRWMPASEWLLGGGHADGSY
ncbi:MAG TPA: ATP-binding protein [Gemmatimonas sp.]|nr:ATP-binding protein [Gemmatimonas sp.]